MAPPHQHPRIADDAYATLRRRAGHLAAQERPNHTLTPTALVHEAFLRVVRDSLTPDAGAPFVAAATRAMRRILVEHARARTADRRDRRRHVDLDLDDLPAPDDAGDATRGEDLLALLRTVSDEHAQIFEARILRGQSTEAIAAASGLSRRTVQYRLRAALAWLAAHIAQE